MLAIVVSALGVVEGALGGDISVTTLPKIVLDIPKAVDVDTAFVVNVERGWVSPRLRARAFRGTLSELLTVPKDAMVVDGCIVYDSLLLRFRPEGGALQFSRFKKDWLAANGRKEAYVIIFEVAADPMTGTRLVKLRPTAISTYFTNGYEIEVRPKAATPVAGVTGGPSAQPSDPRDLSTEQVGPLQLDVIKGAKKAACVANVRQVGLDLLQLAAEHPCTGAGS
jgi:hypothetical protein